MSDSAKLKNENAVQKALGGVRHGCGLLRMQSGLTQMLEAPAAAEDKAAGEEQGEPADSAPHTGRHRIQPVGREAGLTLEGRPLGPCLQGTQVTRSAQAKELLAQGIYIPLYYICVF